jgi:hypothetical protein
MCDTVPFFNLYNKNCAILFAKLYGIAEEKLFDPEYVEERRAVRKCRLAKDLKIMRQCLRDYGIEKFKNELIEQGILESNTYRISTNKNIFAKFIAGEIMPSYGDASDHPDFFFAHNLQINDDNVHNAHPQWLGKASMSETHKFIVPRDLSDWTNLSGLTLGIGGPEEAKKAIEMLECMKEYAIKKVEINEENLGFYLHISPFNSINLLHLHVIDMQRAGPSFSELSFKNLALNEMLQVLSDEISYAVPKL